MMSTDTEEPFAEKVDKILIEWLKKLCPPVGKSSKSKDDQKLIKPNVTAKTVCEKAKEYSNLLGKLAPNQTSEKPFSADQNWYNDFVAGALQKNIELKPAPIASLSDELTSGKYQLEHIWLGAHFALFPMRMPEGSLFAKDEVARGKKRSRKHLSLLITANMAADFHRVKSLIVLSTEADFQKTKKEFEDTMVIECDKAKGRLSKKIMLKWLRENFYEEARAYYEAQNLLINSQIPPTVLFLNECFKEYFDDETLPPLVKICYFSEGQKMEFGTEINTKTFIVKPFVAGYIKKLLMSLEIANKDESILDKWNDCSIKTALNIIDILIIECHRSHIAAFIPQFCFNCSSIFTNSNVLQSFQDKVNETIVQIVKDSNRLELGISIKELSSLIDDNLNFSSLVEDLTATDDAIVNIITPVTPSTSSSSSSAVKRPADSSSATPKSKRAKLSISLTDHQKGQLNLHLFNVTNALDNLTKAQDYLKSFSESSLDVTAKQELQNLIEHWERKSAKLKESLSFGHKQMSITKFFVVNKSTSSSQQGGDKSEPSK